MIDVGSVVRVTRQGALADDSPDIEGETGVVIEVDEVSYYVIAYQVELFSDPGIILVYYDGDIEEV